MHEINSSTEYEQLFHPPLSSTVHGTEAHFSAVSEAHKLALDIRKFEIELYWKRASYFWTLIAAAFAAFFALAAADPPSSQLIFLVTCLGTVLSAGWYLVNRGSKYWQENWERHVDVLEDLVMGPLYKTTLSPTRTQWLRPFAGYPYSVSKVNQIISLFVWVVWMGLALRWYPRQFFADWLKIDVVDALAITTGFTLVFLCWAARTGHPKHGRVVRFQVSDLRSSPTKHPLEGGGRDENMTPSTPTPISESAGPAPPSPEAGTESS